MNLAHEALRDLPVGDLGLVKETVAPSSAPHHLHLLEF